MGAMENIHLSQLLAILPRVGRDFVGYASDTASETISSMANGDQPISENVKQATNELHALINNSLPSNNSEPGASINVNAHLDILNISMLMGSQYEGNSIANAVRILIGASLPSIDTNDNLETELVKLATDIYPLLLLPHDTNDMMPGYMNISSMISPSIHRNKYNSFFDAFTDDETLGSLHVHGGGNERLLKSMYYSVNTGMGAHQQLASVPIELAMNAYYKCKIEATISSETFLTEVIEQFRMYRKLVSGEAVHAKAYVAINGIILPNNAHMELPWGTLRTPTSTEHELLDGRTQLTNAILEVPFKLKLKRHRSFIAPYAFINDKERDNVEEAAMLTAATIMVALGKEIRAENAGMIILQVVGHAPLLSWPFEKYGVAQTKLKSSERAAVLKLAPTVNEHKKRLNIALRRNLMAIARVDSVDGFIDGITAMESLFGSKKETTFTVSAAMAKFIEPKLADRQALQKEIANKLYDERSKIVHGSSFPSPRTIETKRQRVIDLNLMALRKLLRRRKNLINLSSSERSAKILLG